MLLKPLLCSFNSLILFIYFTHPVGTIQLYLKCLCKFNLLRRKNEMIIKLEHSPPHTHTHTQHKLCDFSFYSIIFVDASGISSNIFYFKNINIIYFVCVCVFVGCTSPAAWLYAYLHVCEQHCFIVCPIPPYAHHGY